MLQLLRAIHEVVGIYLGQDPPLIWLLDKILVALLLRKVHGILSRLEIQMRALHAIRRRLPPHQRILPSMPLLQHIPVHPPLMRVPFPRLSRRLRRTVDPGGHTSQRSPTIQRSSSRRKPKPNCATLQINRSARKHCCRHYLAWLAAIHDPPRNGGKCPAIRVCQQLLFFSFSFSFFFFLCAKRSGRWYAHEVPWSTRAL